MVDASQADESSEGPSAFRGVTAFSYRIEGTRCQGDMCMESSCGDTGILVLGFEPPEEASEVELGYRMIWVGRPLPLALRSRLDRVLPLDPSTREVYLELGFDAVTLLDGELSLVAVDHAGRESAPSELARVSFSGCTEYFDQPYCLGGGPMPRSGSDVHCSVAQPRRDPPSPLAAALGLGLFTLLGARRARRKLRD